MARILWFCQSDDDSLLSVSAIAAELVAGGHEVRLFAARSVDSVDCTVAGQADLAAYGGQETECYLTSPGVAAELTRAFRSMAPDLVVIDAMFPTALTVAPGFGVPGVVVCHGLLGARLDHLKDTYRGLMHTRMGAGFDPLPGIEMLWHAEDLLLVLADAAADMDLGPDWGHVRHVGAMPDGGAERAAEAIATVTKRRPFSFD